MKFLKKILSFIKSRFFIYLVVGGIAAIIDFSLFYAFNSIFLISYAISHPLSSWISATIKFAINKFFTFKNKSRKIMKQYLASMGVFLIYLLITEGMLLFFVGVLNINELISKVLVILLGVLINYFLDKKITFGKRFV